MLKLRCQLVYMICYAKGITEQGWNSSQIKIGLQLLWLVIGIELCCCSRFGKGTQDFEVSEFALDALQVFLFAEGNIIDLVAIVKDIPCLLQTRNQILEVLSGNVEVSRDLLD